MHIAPVVSPPSCFGVHRCFDLGSSYRPESCRTFRRQNPSSKTMLCNPGGKQTAKILIISCHLEDTTGAVIVIQAKNIAVHRFNHMLCIPAKEFKSFTRSHTISDGRPVMV